MIARMSALLNRTYFPSFRKPTAPLQVRWYSQDGFTCNIRAASSVEISDFPPKALSTSRDRFEPAEHWQMSWRRPTNTNPLFWQARQTGGPMLGGSKRRSLRE